MSAAIGPQQPEGVIPSDGQRSPRAGITILELPLPKQTTECWIRFGSPFLDQVLNHRCRLLCFDPGSIFAVVRWASTDGGTAHSMIDIMRAVPRGEAYSTLADVAPGAEPLLHLDGWSKVHACLVVIDAIESLAISPCTVAPDYWRYVQKQLVAGDPVRGYSWRRHRAWLHRSLRA